MRMLEWTFKRHDPYLAALQMIVKYMAIVGGFVKDEAPTRDKVVKSLAVAVIHLVNRNDCIACSASRSLEKDELAFLSAYGKFSEHPEYRRWLKTQTVSVCFADGQDDETADDPLNCISVCLNAKRLDAIGNSMRITAEEMLSETTRRLHGG